jgi:hypothetical protein
MSMMEQPSRTEPTHQESQLRSQSNPTELVSKGGRGSSLTECRECSGTVSEQATQCPHCGAPYPAKPEWDGFGYEYKSETTLFGIPLVHISFKYKSNRQPVVAKGIISIGQFGVGVFNISQFGLGVVSVGQFSAAAWAIAQFGFANRLIAQVGVYVTEGMGQYVWKLADLLSFL